MIAINMTYLQATNMTKQDTKINLLKEMKLMHKINFFKLGKINFFINSDFSSIVFILLD